MSKLFHAWNTSYKMQSKSKTFFDYTFYKSKYIRYTITNGDRIDSAEKEIKKSGIFGKLGQNQQIFFKCFRAKLS